MQPFLVTMRTTLLAVVSGLLLAGCQEQKQSPGAAAPPPPPQISVIAVQPQRVLLTTQLPGRSSAYRVAEIRPQVNGLIQKRMFVEGANVKAGDVLYQIDPASFQAALNNAEAALGRSEANLPAARSRAERYRELLVEKAVSQQDYDDAAAALKKAEADVQYWKAALETARINLAYTRITAPISGRIGRSSVTEGAIVTAYQPVALAIIQQLDPIYVDVPLSTTDLMRMKRSLKNGRLRGTGKTMEAVTLILDNGSSYAHEGTLQFRDVTVDPTTGSVIQRVVFPNPNGLLLPGMFVRAVMREGVAEKAILIPQQSISRDPKGHPVALVAGAGDTVERRMLTLDRAIDDQWLVSDGLAAGDRLIVEGIQKVRPGTVVAAVPYDDGEETKGTTPAAATAGTTN
ncbi:efflux RND transporter periplasmic adaptor subunit [Desulfosarcina ovata]|uniref:MexX family efflux pump subunit n=1 Tax=Desulfosarcina ovata subsp. ovata TaxID=2752305 RepID=A0A5K8A4B0_9BACT|nr:efflux RND transporter periplasmic adaptor subunit [Desulfosarcina ovata]BBO87248.1 MexX family efflux pump subunit [Desulfosarcina ovata subsp. ovata]